MHKSSINNGIDYGNFSLPEGRSIKEIASRKSKRIERLRSFLIETIPEISSERVRHYTEVYESHEHLPVVLKRAEAFSKMLEEMSLYILDEELIVGNTAVTPRGVELFPEFEVEWIKRELEGEPYSFDERPVDRFIIREETRKELKKLLTYWNGKTHYERVNALLPDEAKKAWEMMVLNSYWLMQGGDGHITVNFKKILQIGIKGFIERIEQKLLDLKIYEPDYAYKKAFYDAALIALKGVVNFAKRYSDYARKLAGEEQNQRRKRELERISQICGRVPYEPAANLHEAIQTVWFIQAVLQIESNGHSVSLGRLDQTLYPYFRCDIESGRLTVEEASELFQNFWLKLFTVNKIRDWDSTRFFAGYQVFQNITIGGQHSGGRDATNELSYMFLGVQKAIQLTSPSLSVRFHDNISRDFLWEVVDVIRLGGGQPALYSDETIIPALMNRGIDYEDAVNWSVVGCVEPIIEGKEGYRPNGASFISMLKILELTLHGGRDPKTGYVLLPIRKDLSSFSSFKELLQKWEEQADYYIKLQVAMDNIIDLSMEELAPNPLVSCFVDDCIERGKTIKQGGAIYDYCGPLIVGLANTGDSLASIKKLVFEEREITGGELLHAIDTNFTDNSTDPTGTEIQRMVLGAPKYGNDDDYVDSLTALALRFFCNELPRYKVTRYGRGPRGCIWQASTSTVSGNVPFGQYIGATPDGRLDGEPTADTTSPAHGMDKSGPIRTMKSVARIPNVLCSGGNLFNMKFSPLVLNDDVGKSKFISLIRTFLGDLKGMHVQFNIVDSDALRDAKVHPEKYPDLMVRVAGYSALFTSLDPEVQDDIIERTENMMM